MQYGNGCALDDRHTLTALHCLVDVQKAGAYPVVWREEGNFKGECQKAGACRREQVWAAIAVAELGVPAMLPPSKRIKLVDAPSPDCFI